AALLAGEIASTLSVNADDAVTANAAAILGLRFTTPMPVRPPPPYPHLQYAPNGQPFITPAVMLTAAAPNRQTSEDAAYFNPSAHEFVPGSQWGWTPQQSHVGNETLHLVQGTSPE
ncbi:unnamed protein product, partial [Polarella glacialis]